MTHTLTSRSRIRKAYLPLATIVAVGVSALAVAALEYRTGASLLRHHRCFGVAGPMAGSGATPDLPPRLQRWSVIAQVRLSATDEPNYQHIVLDTAGPLRLSIHKEGYLRAYTASGFWWNRTASYVAPDVRVPLDKWCQVAWVFDRGSLAAYVDGRLHWTAESGESDAKFNQPRLLERAKPGQMGGRFLGKVDRVAILSMVVPTRAMGALFSHLDAPPYASFRTGAVATSLLATLLVVGATWPIPWSRAKTAVVGLLAVPGIGWAGYCTSCAIAAAARKMHMRPHEEVVCIAVASVLVLAMAGDVLTSRWVKLRSALMWGLIIGQLGLTVLYLQQNYFYILPVAS